MTLQQIFYLLVIENEGSINKAAETLYMSQPSLTNAVKELEAELGICIFSRSNRGVLPTVEGMQFLIKAKQLYQQYELLTERYHFSGKRKRTFGVSTQHYSFAVKAFVETVKKYDTSQFEFWIEESRTKEVIRDVADLYSEIGILYISEYNKKVILKLLESKDLEFYELIRCKACVYLWKEHPLAGQSSISMSQLQMYPCLTFSQGNESSFFAEEILGENEYSHVIRVNDRMTMINLMRGLNGYTLCSGIICEELNGDEYIAVPFAEDNKNKNCIMTIGYIVKKQSIRSEVALTYLQELKKYLKNAP